jgi:hypothetical protein
LGLALSLTKPTHRGIDDRRKVWLLASVQELSMSVAHVSAVATPNVNMLPFRQSSASLLAGLDFYWFCVNKLLVPKHLKDAEYTDAWNEHRKEIHGWSISKTLEELQTSGFPETAVTLTQFISRVLARQSENLLFLAGSPSNENPLSWLNSEIAYVLRDREIFRLDKRVKSRAAFDVVLARFVETAPLDLEPGVLHQEAAKWFVAVCTLLLGRSEIDRYIQEAGLDALYASWEGDDDLLVPDLYQEDFERTTLRVYMFAKSLFGLESTEAHRSTFDPGFDLVVIQLRPTYKTVYRAILGFFRLYELERALPKTASALEQYLKVSFPAGSEPYALSKHGKLSTLHDLWDKSYMDQLRRRLAFSVGDL